MLSSNKYVQNRECESEKCNIEQPGETDGPSFDEEKDVNFKLVTPECVDDTMGNLSPNLKKDELQHDSPVNGYSFGKQEILCNLNFLFII